MDLQDRHSSLLQGLSGLGAREATAQIRNGELSAEVYASALLRHHDAWRDLNTLITVDETRVLEEARALDVARANGKKLGPAAGLPFVVKDQMEIAGYPTTAGNIHLKSYVAPRNAAIATALRGAGAVMFGKANCGDMLGGAPILTHGTTSNPFFGVCRNPYNLAHVPGGSSGGVAAAISAGIAPAGIGEDTGGSVRLPAACTGIAGLRPSTFSLRNLLDGAGRKRYSDDGMVPPPALLDTWGPMARTVADLALLDHVITGSQATPASLDNMRIGVPRPDYWETDVIDPGVARLLLSTFDRMRGAGAVLVEYDLLALMRRMTGPRDRVGCAVRRPNPQSLGAWLAANFPAVTLGDIQSYLPALQLTDTDRDALYTGETFAAGERERLVAELESAHADFFRDHGFTAFALPTLRMTAPLINPNGDTPGQHIQVNGTSMNEIMAFVSHTRLAARLGAPALNIPIGLSDGLPVGMELQGAPGRDVELLGLGMAIEAILDRFPPPSMRFNGANGARGKS